MKKKNLSIKELAAVIGVSTDTIRRAVRKGEIPATRVRTALRFDLHNVLTCMRRNAEAKFGARSACAPGGTAGRAQDDQSPSGNTRARIAEGSRQDLRRILRKSPRVLPSVWWGGPERWSYRRESSVRPVVTIAGQKGFDIRDHAREVVGSIPSPAQTFLV